jgi:hypothetical protein
VKGLNDAADAYAIGGIGLYDYAHYSNPLIRGYGFYSQNFGTSEQLEMFYRWIAKIKNNSLFELMNQNLNRPSLIEEALKSHINILSKNKPKMLFNYKFESNSYHLRNEDYFIIAKHSKGGYYLKELLHYSFPFADPKNISSENIILRNISYKQNKLYANPPTSKVLNIKNFSSPVSISSGAEPFNIPIYEFYGRLETRELSFVNPPGTRLEEFILCNSRISRNNVVWLFTKISPPIFGGEFVDNEFESENRIKQY